MVYKSNCRACDHPHDGMICSHITHKVGTIRLRSYNHTLWGVGGGLAKGWDNSNGSEQLSFKMFQTNLEEPFEYNQETDCGCRFYVPTENLEFLEWKYNESNSK